MNRASCTRITRIIRLLKQKTAQIILHFEPGSLGFWSPSTQIRLQGGSKTYLSFDIVLSSHPRHSELRRTNNTMISHVYANFEVTSRNGWLPRVFIHSLMHYSLPDALFITSDALFVTR